MMRNSSSLSSQMIRKTILICCLLLWQSLTYAQRVTDHLVRFYEPNSYWLTLRADYYFKSGSFIYFENNSRFGSAGYSSDDYRIPIGVHTFPFNKIYRMYFMGGFEYKASENWYLGGSEKIVLIPGRNSFYSRINISHRGKLLKLRFIKEAALEHLKYPGSKNPNSPVYNEGRVSFSASLVKEFKLADRKLFAIFSYRPYIIFDWTSDGFSAYDKRFIDKTRLRVEAAYFVTDRFLVSLFAIRDTDYGYRLPIFDASQNLISEEARLNRIAPTFGISLNYVLHAPDDFIPGFPVK